MIVNIPMVQIVSNRQFLIIMFRLSYRIIRFKGFKKRKQVALTIKKSIYII